MENLLQKAADSLMIPNTSDIRGNITLPESLDGGIKVSWSSSNEAVVNTMTITKADNDDYAEIPLGVVTRGNVDENVKLVATLSLNDNEVTKEFNLTVKANNHQLNESDYEAYFFTYFTGEYHDSGEQVYFALSKDGLHWDNVNDNKPVLVSNQGEMGVRDPFIIRSHEGDKFFVIATDLRIAGNFNWGKAQTNGSQSIMVWESTDLINWSEPRLVKIARPDAGCTWAPEVFYDKKTGEYLVYWASRVALDQHRKQRIYCAKTRDFCTFTKPEIYIEREQDVIDTTMIEYDGIYYRFSKDEVNKNIILDASDRLLGKEFKVISAPVVESQKGVEGPTIFKFNGEKKWCLLLDQYGGRGYYPLVSEDLSSGVFRKLEEDEFTMPKGPRHGTVIPITKKEYEALIEKWGIKNE